MQNKELSYEEMTKGGVYEDSEESTDRVPFQNAYELARNSEFDQSGMKGGK